MQSWAQTPAPGERLLRFVGDRIQFTLRTAEGGPPPAGWRGRLRTNLGRATALRQEIIAATRTRRPPTLLSWRDIPLRQRADGWFADFPLAEVGYFRAKAYALDTRGWQHWPDGADVGLNVQPDACRTGNTIYCAFTRMFGPSKTLASTTDAKRDLVLKDLDQQQYTVIPPSGRFRDLIRELPHVFQTLGCRILHLLPVNPTPTTYARFGRFGSPYACQDLLAVDPALVELDKRTTGIDQFRELTYAAHSLGGRVFLDMVINHTGWGATLQERSPEWFLRDAQGRFVSPGAWGTTWEDLVELEQSNPELREYLAEAFLEWCRRGVDGFRCDAGYKVPVPVWQYITARVRQEFPDTVFLLEGLGGGWQDTENLLTEGGMQWAYSELFQNYSGTDVAHYLAHALPQSHRVGLLVNYSETHDNERLAARGREWSLLRNRLCALTSVAGGYGFTCGVEWLATERVNVHSSRGLSWRNPDNLVPELARLNHLLSEHPCFFDGASLTTLTPPASPVFGLRRLSAEGLDAVLVLVNTNPEGPETCELQGSEVFRLSVASVQDSPGELVDLLGQTPPVRAVLPNGRVRFTLPAGSAFCLSARAEPRGVHGAAYRMASSLKAQVLRILSQHLDIEDIPAANIPEFSRWLQRDPASFLGAAARLDHRHPPENLSGALRTAGTAYPQVVEWTLNDRRRITLVPPGHWLLVRDSVQFRAQLAFGGDCLPVNLESIPVNDGQIACFYAPDSPTRSMDAKLEIERYAPGDQHVSASVRFLSATPQLAGPDFTHRPASELVLLTNGRGGMARLCADLGKITSKYDCLLGANLHSAFPVDRHVLVKRVRLWADADGFLSSLDGGSLASFSPGPPARWAFVAYAGDGRAAGIELVADMIDGENTTVLRFERMQSAPWDGCALPAECEVRLTVRLDLEDRNFHWETKRNTGAEVFFTQHVKPLDDRPGFSFIPAADRRLYAFADGGVYHPQPEWCENIPHPVEESRGMQAFGDAYSPGWFELLMPAGTVVHLVVSAESVPPITGVVRGFVAQRADWRTGAIERSGLPSSDPFGGALATSAHAFLARREEGRTVVAGYPWFLDWGRDTLICARGLLAAGLQDEVTQLLLLFGRFERDGTLPNTIHGQDTSNRDTSDAPLWFGIVCEEAAALDPDRHAAQPPFYEQVVSAHGRTLGAVLHDIAAGYIRGTPNGIRMDPASGLIWSPSHFTWMDTNYPAATPREGYPIEIQALWIRLLRQLARLGLAPVQEPWAELARRAEESVTRLMWSEERGYFVDVLRARSGQGAAEGEADDALRSNGLFMVTLGLATGEPARRCVAACLRHLAVPGALRSLAPLPVSRPSPVRAPDGRLLNDPLNPYWGRYEGDEDTRRKPAYHNGTAWVWTFPTLCEALARAWEFAPSAVEAARAYLGSLDRLMSAGCMGQLPEIVDGDAPHEPRGCDAQAWSVTEALRVWRLLAPSAST